MSRGTRIVMPVVGLAVAVVVGVVTPASPAAADEPYPVPDRATIVLKGDGSGHGIGFSQYGAYGAARAPHRLTSGEILDFYYPGTRSGSAGGRVKVWISGDDDRDLVVDARDGLRIGKVGGRATRARARGARLWRVKATRAGHVVSYRSRGSRWRTWRRIAGDVEVTAGRAPVRLHTPDRTVRYRGALRSVAFRRQRLTVNVLPMELYVRGVVPAEMQAGWPTQALRAQAVAARTFATYERGDGHRYYDVCDTPACQSYGGASAEARATTRAVRATARDVLTHDGEVAYAQYSASNGGWTVADDRFPYLVAQRDPYEGTSSDYYGWTVRLSSRKVEQVYGFENLSEIQIRSRDGHGRRGGRVTAIRATTVGGKAPGTYPLDVDNFRRNFGLPSTLFEITAVR